MGGLGDEFGEDDGVRAFEDLGQGCGQDEVSMMQW